MEGGKQSLLKLAIQFLKSIFRAFVVHVTITHYIDLTASHGTSFHKVGGSDPAQRKQMTFPVSKILKKAQQQMCSYGGGVLDCSWACVC